MVGFQKETQLGSKLETDNRMISWFNSDATEEREMQTAEMVITNGLPNRWYVEQKLNEIKREARALRHIIRAIDLAEGNDTRPRTAAGSRSRGAV
jgi:hypothetical protein